MSIYVLESCESEFGSCEQIFLSGGTGLKVICCEIYLWIWKGYIQGPLQSGHLGFRSWRCVLGCFMSAALINNMSLLSLSALSRLPIILKNLQLDITVQNDACSEEAIAFCIRCRLCFWMHFSCCVRCFSAKHFWSVVATFFGNKKSQCGKTSLRTQLTVGSERVRDDCGLAAFCHIFASLTGSFWKRLLA